MRKVTFSLVHYFEMIACFPLLVVLRVCCLFGPSKMNNLELLHKSTNLNKGYLTNNLKLKTNCKSEAKILSGVKSHPEISKLISKLNSKLSEAFKICQESSFCSLFPYYVKIFTVKEFDHLPKVVS